MLFFQTIPFIRILLPFVAGILFSLNFNFLINPFSLIPIWLTVILLEFVTKGVSFYKVILLMVCDVFLFLFATVLVNLNNTSKSQNYYGNKIDANALNYVVAVVDDIPVEKENWIKCNLRLLKIKTVKGYEATIGNVIAYFKKSSKSKVPKVEEGFLIRGQLSEISEPKNPFEFDYKNYLYNKQVYHTIFIEPSHVTPLAIKQNTYSLKLLGLRCKDFVINRIRNSSLNQKAYAICAALLTGFDDDIETPILDSFAHSGTLHVLSVSGLHVGLIYLLISNFFNLWDPNKKRKILRFAFTTLLLWIFALITGFSAPVLRSVIMFNLFGIGKIWFRNDYRNQMNILAVSAFIILFYNPFLITDIGFLLSFSALSGLIYFQPKISALWQPSSLVYKYTWQSITTSLAATITTLPITLYYFKQFPLWFFISNIVVVPLSFLVLIVALPLIFKINFFAFIVNFLVSVLLLFINLFDSVNFAYVDNIHFTLIDTFFLTILILLAAILFQSRSYGVVSSFVITLIVWQLMSLGGSWMIKNTSNLSVYSIKKENIYAVKNKNKVILNTCNLKSFLWHIKPHFISNNYVDTVSTPFNYVKSGKKEIIVLNQPGFWPIIDSCKITDLMVANNFELLETDFQKFTHLKSVIVDASNNSCHIKRTEELCRKFGFDFYNTKKIGAHLIDLP